MAALLPDPSADDATAAALDRFSAQLPRGARAEPAPDAGLINGTWLVLAPRGEAVAVLQWLNPLFSPLIHHDIAALLERLEDQGLPGPRLLPTDAGQRWAEAERGAWRLWSFVPGRTLHTVPSTAVAAAAGGLVGRFHRAVAGWRPERHAPLRQIHDTPLRMRELEEALAARPDHPLAAEAQALGAQLLADWAAWGGTLDEPEVIGHGDLKISNLRFDEAGQEARCLLDLDTVGPIGLSAELGDAWRSWCNPSGEDSVDDVNFDVSIFEASATAFLEAGPALDPARRAALAHAPERICLELAGRFCRDAVLNAYFREDRARFPAPGAHNLHRARVQAQLARSAKGRSAALLRALRPA